MKLRKSAFVLALLAAFMCFAFSAFAESGHPSRVIDYADLLTDEEEAALEKRLGDISDSRNFDIVVATTDDAEGKTAMEYADDLFDYGGYGMGESGIDGILMLIDMDNRDIWISTKGRGIDTFSDSDIQSVIDTFYDYVKNGDYYNACDTFISTVSGRFDDDAYDEYYESLSGIEQYKISFSVLGRVIIPLAIGFVIALIVTAVMKGKLKSVRKNVNAAAYVVGDSFKLDVSRDTFLYSTVTRTKRVEESSSSDGGSSTHTSSSGSTHGGGGRSF